MEEDGSYEARRSKIPQKKGKLYGYCHCCHKFGHKDADYRTKGKDQILRRKQDTKA